MRDIRRALLEADVSLDVVKKFISEVKQKAIGQEIIRSISPGQMIIKLVNDELINILGSDTAVINIDGKNYNLSKYQGKVILLVNVASNCGFTKQYDDLQNLWEKH